MNVIQKFEYSCGIVYAYEGNDVLLIYPHM